MTAKNLSAIIISSRTSLKTVLSKSQISPTFTWLSHDVWKYSWNLWVGIKFSFKNVEWCAIRYEVVANIGGSRSESRCNTALWSYQDRLYPLLTMTAIHWMSTDVSTLVGVAQFAHTTRWQACPFRMLSFLLHWILSQILVD